MKRFTAILFTMILLIGSASAERFVKFRFNADDDSEDLIHWYIANEYKCSSHDGMIFFEPYDDEFLMGAQVLTWVYIKIYGGKMLEENLYMFGSMQQFALDLACTYDLNIKQGIKESSYRLYYPDDPVFYIELHKIDDDSFTVICLTEKTAS